VKKLFVILFILIGSVIPVYASEQFSYQFTGEDGSLEGRVVSDNGEIRIYALRENGTFAIIRHENGSFYRGATGDTVAEPNEIAAFLLAYGNILNDSEKYIFNFMYSLPAPIPAKKAQLDWLIHGAGGEDIVGRTSPAGVLEPLDETVTGQFSYFFRSEDGNLAGKVTGNHGEIIIYALDETGAFTPVQDGDVFELAFHFTQHFATMTRVGHTHTFPHPLSVLSTEDYPVYAGSDRIITFGYDGQNTGGMMRAATLEGITKFISDLQNTLPAPAGGIRIFINGELVETDVEPMIVSGRTMVPLRVVAEALGVDVRWDDETRTVYIIGEVQ